MDAKELHRLMVAIMNDPDLLRAHADALEENARLKAELAKLRQHAEAMAKELESIRDLDGWYFQSVTDLVRAFRADFPEEK